MKKYECLYIIDNTLSKINITEIINNIEIIVQKKSSEIEINQLGEKKLAYEIKKHSEGFYVLIKFKTDQKFIFELENKLKLNEKIIKYLIVSINNKKNRKKIKINRKPIKNIQEYEINKNIKKSNRFTKFNNKFNQKSTQTI